MESNSSKKKPDTKSQTLSNLNKNLETNISNIIENAGEGNNIDGVDNTISNDTDDAVEWIEGNEEDEEARVELGLIGKIWTDRSINSNAFMETIKSVWQPRHGHGVKDCEGCRDLDDSNMKFGGWMKASPWKSNREDKDNVLPNNKPACAKGLFITKPKESVKKENGEEGDISPSNPPILLPDKENSLVGIESSQIHENSSQYVVSCVKESVSGPQLKKSKVVIRKDRKNLATNSCVTTIGGTRKRSVQEEGIDSNDDGAGVNNGKRRVIDSSSVNAYYDTDMTDIVAGSTPWALGDFNLMMWSTEKQGGVDFKYAEAAILWDALTT
uniref:Uncharacterized protein n=1 Tax=Chenopodium quinoa TaxID=63459 RepID=A0A803LQM5_CHEQI